ncbi:MAG: hypothetical protein IJ733_12500 [Lachnospiraceae bacterium]|nr:hypothetical protein [Lachnospiraceae bacterium]
MRRDALINEYNTLTTLYDTLATLCKPFLVSVGVGESRYWFEREEYLESRLEGLDMREMVWRIR